MVGSYPVTTTRTISVSPASPIPSQGILQLKDGTIGRYASARRRSPQKTIIDKTEHSTGAVTLLVCLAPQIAAGEVETLALGIVDWHKAPAPSGDTVVIFRDSAFADDAAKTNLTATLDQHGLNNVRSL